MGWVTGLWISTYNACGPKVFSLIREPSWKLDQPPASVSSLGVQTQYAGAGLSALYLI